MIKQRMAVFPIQLLSDATQNNDTHVHVKQPTGVQLFGAGGLHSRAAAGLAW